MPDLNWQAKETLKQAGISQADWIRFWFGDAGKWLGDACGCRDDRCLDGYHHEPDEDCGCLPSTIRDLDYWVQVSGEPDPRRPRARD